MIGSGAIGSFAIGSSAGDSAVVGDAVLLFEQNIIAIEGHATLFFEQSVVADGDATLLFEQDVTYPFGDAILLFEQNVGAVGDATLLFSQNVYDPVLVADSWVDWDATVIVDGVDLNDDLIGTMTVDAERSAARIADFTILLSGVVDIKKWKGRSVEIDYIQNTGATWRRFTGVVQDAQYDSLTKSLHCICTDNYQRIVDGYTKEQLLELTGGFHSSHVFNEDSTGFDCLNDLLSTVSKSVELDSNKQLTVNSLQNKAVPDYTFDDNLVLTNSLTVKSALTDQLINKVNIEFNARFNRHYHINKSVNWRYSRLFCEHHLAPAELPDQDAIISALNNSGWALNSISFTPIWPTNNYSCDGGVVTFVNDFPQGIIGFNANSALRWSQSITEKYKTTVTCDDSIREFTELDHSLSASAGFDGSIEGWGDADDDFKVIPAEFVQIGGYFAFDDVDASEIDEANEVLVNQAVTLINSSHQEDSVFFDLPLSPFVELDQTIAVSDGEIDTKAIIRRFTETYNFDTNEPITSIELAISSGESGADLVNQVFTSPTKPSLIEDPSQYLFSAITVLDHVGGLFESLPENPDWTGIFLNASYPENFVVPSGTVPPITYSQGIKIEFPDIDDALVKNSDVEHEASINITVPDNLLTVTA